MAIAKTFRSGEDEAVPIPREMAFGEGVELTVERKGDVLTMSPLRRTIADLVAELRRLPAPDAVEVRDVEPLPEREGL